MIKYQLIFIYVFLFTKPYFDFKINLNNYLKDEDFDTHQLFLDFSNKYEKFYPQKFQEREHEFKFDVNIEDLIKNERMDDLDKTLNNNPFLDMDWKEFKDKYLMNFDFEKRFYDFKKNYPETFEKFNYDNFMKNKIQDGRFLQSIPYKQTYNNKLNLFSKNIPPRNYLNPSLDIYPPQKKTNYYNPNHIFFYPITNINRFQNKSQTYTPIFDKTQKKVLILNTNEKFSPIINNNQKITPIINQKDNNQNFTHIDNKSQIIKNPKHSAIILNPKPAFDHNNLLLTENSNKKENINIKKSSFKNTNFGNKKIKFINKFDIIEEKKYFTKEKKTSKNNKTVVINLSNFEKKLKLIQEQLSKLSKNMKKQTEENIKNHIFTQNKENEKKEIKNDNLIIKNYTSNIQNIKEVENLENMRIKIPRRHIKIKTDKDVLDEVSIKEKKKDPNYMKNLKKAITMYVFKNMLKKKIENLDNKQDKALKEIKEIKKKIKEQKNPILNIKSEIKQEEKRKYIISDELKNFPKKKSWVQYASKVFDQMDCAACYATSSISAIEMEYKKKFNEKIKLSVQEIVDCSEKNNGCKGGDPFLVFKYIKKNGLSYDYSYPYINMKGICLKQKLKTMKKFKKNLKLYFFDNPVDLVKGLNYGPVVIVHHANKKLMKYAGGIFNPKKENCTGKLNHAALAVGYNLTDDMPYILVKNAWGKKWGENGYYRISIGDVTRSSNGVCHMFEHTSNVIVDIQ